MKIEFHGPSVCDFSKMDKYGYIEVEEGTTLKQFLKIVKLPVIWRKIFPLLLNYEEAPMDTVLKDGDIVTSFSVISGG